MSDVAVEVRGLGKQYRLAGVHEKEETLCGYLAGAARQTLANLRNLFTGGAANLGSETTWALRDVSFEVKRGEVFGIIGPNGAGKSTLLKILSRVTEPTEGRAVLHGRVGSLLEVGTGFHEELTGRENVYLSGAILGMTRREIAENFDEIVRFSGIGKYIDTPIKRYSSGMRVRLGFAVAAHLEPEILIIDEVLAVGDAEFRKKCLGKMGDVARSGRTVLFVSHNLGQMRQLCSRAIWIDSGNIRMDGDTHEVTLAYEHEVLGIGNEDAAEVARRDPPPNQPYLAEARMSDGNAATAVFSYGDDMVLDLQMIVPEAIHSPEDRIGVVAQLADESDTRISSWASEWCGIAYPKQSQHLRLRLQNLPYYHGEYKLTLGLTRLPTGRIDTWKDALRFTINRCDPFGNGFEISQKSGFVHVPCDWSAPAI